MSQILHNPHYQHVNTTKFVYFALNQNSYILLHTYFLHKNYMYDIYLHICRLVVKRLQILICVFIPNHTAISGPLVQTH